MMYFVVGYIEVFECLCGCVFMIDLVVDFYFDDVL